MASTILATGNGFVCPAGGWLTEELLKHLIVIDMKKFSFAAVLLLFVFSCHLAPLHAQWRIGASGGATYNWYSIDKHYQTDFRYDGAWGWSAAVFTQYNFFDWLGLRAEVEASERNYRFYRTGIFEGTNYVLHNTYVQLPVMAQFSFGGQKVRGFVDAGVYAGFWAAGRYKGTNYDYLLGKTVPLDEPYIFQKEKDQRADFGLAGGLGIEYRFLEHWAVHLEGRCYYSFISNVKQYMEIKDYRFNTTLGMNIGVAYIF